MTSISERPEPIAATKGDEQPRRPLVRHGELHLDRWIEAARFGELRLQPFGRSVGSPRARPQSSRQTTALPPSSIAHEARPRSPCRCSSRSTTTSRRAIVNPRQGAVHTSSVISAWGPRTGYEQWAADRAGLIAERAHGSRGEECGPSASAPRGSVQRKGISPPRHAPDGTGRGGRLQRDRRGHIAFRLALQHGLGAPVAGGGHGGDLARMVGINGGVIEPDQFLALLGSARLTWAHYLDHR